jgi:tryptophan 2,3-dioxygenase
MTALKSKLMATNESTAARLKQNAAVVDDLRTAEALVAKSEENIRKITGRISDLDREHGDLAADEIAGKVDSAAVAVKEKELADAGKDLERANKAHAALTARLNVARDEQQRVATAETRKAIARRLAKFADLARDYEAVERKRGEVWVAFHEVAAEITAAWPKGQVPAGCLLDRP